jgi:hypothetical protein
VEDEAAEAAVVAADAERAVTRLQPAATLRRRPRQQVATRQQVVMPLQVEVPAEAVVDVAAEPVEDAVAEAAMAQQRRLRRRRIPFRR